MDSETISTREMQGVPLDRGPGYRLEGSEPSPGGDTVGAFSAAQGAPARRVDRSGLVLDVRVEFPPDVLDEVIARVRLELVTGHASRPSERYALLDLLRQTALDQHRVRMENQRP